MFCPDVHTNWETGIVHLNDRERLTIGPRGGNGGEISGYRPERRFVSMQQYAREVARQGQQGGGVATTAAPQPPQPQYVARSQLFQMADAQVTALGSGIAQPLSDIDGYYSGHSTGKEGKEEGKEDHIEKLRDQDKEDEEGQGDSSAEEEEESESEEERDVRLDEDKREERSTVVHTQSGYPFMDERRKMTAEVTSGDDKRAHIEEEVTEVSTTASNQEK